MGLVRSFCICSLAIFPLLAADEISFALPDVSSILPSEESFIQRVVEGNNRFGFSFYQSVRHQQGNFCFSPYGMAAGLALPAAGAKGRTLKEFESILNYSANYLPVIGNLNGRFSQKSNTQILLANSLWVQEETSLLASFKFKIDIDLLSFLQQVNFAKNTYLAIQSINQWVSKKTDGRINHLLLQYDANRETKLILASAIQLNAGWQFPFDLKETKRLPFQVSPRRSFSSNMMHAVGQYPLWKGENEDLIVIPCAHTNTDIQLALAILLPKNRSVEEIEENLNDENWNMWLKKLQTQPVSLTVPRFQMDQRFDLQKSLKGIDASVIFSKDADYSGMSNEKNIFLNAAVHKTRIDFNEAGLGSPSARRFQPIEGGQDQDRYEFKADKPFVFVLWEQKSNTILLMGRLSLP